MKILKIIPLLLILSACGSVKQIGKVNMISTRNVDPNKTYVSISTYSGGSKKELRKSRSKSLEDAIDRTVKKVPGGEFLVNVKVYLVKDRFLAVEGDVWGTDETISYRGFKVGDKVTWKFVQSRLVNGYKTGTITSLKDDKTCLIKSTEGEIVEKRYDDITKVTE